MKSKEILEALNWRYGVKEFDPSRKVSEEDLHTILESGRLAPSSIGLEPWKFLVVKNPALREQIREASWGQSKVTDSSHLVILARRTDYQNLAQEIVERTAATHGKTEEELAGLRGMAEGGLSRPEDQVHKWLAHQSYIALGMMIETAALLQIDTGPMEGFDAGKVDEILNLTEKNLASQSILAIGYHGEDKYANLPRVRRSFEEVVEVIE